MRKSKSWIVAAKDIKVFMRKRYTVYSLVVFPVLIGIGLPFVLRFVISRIATVSGGTHITDVMDAFSFLFVLGASVIPTVLASYSLVGEKIEKSLEPLLATPLTDSELLFGKSLASFVPSVASLYIGSIVFMVLADLFTHSTLGYYYYPNWTVGIMLLVLVPLMAVLSVEWSVIVSSRATDPRAAQLQGSLVALPLAVLYVSMEVGAVTLNTITIWIIAGIVLVVDVVLFFLSTRIFQREEILTKWT